MGNIYICTGSCHGVATEEQYQTGARTCSSKSCEKYGVPLEPRIQCQYCAQKGQKQACGGCLKPT